VSELLNDSPTAVKFRDRILSELGDEEQVLYAADGQVIEPTGTGSGDFNLYVGSIIVTTVRLLVVEGKMLGGARLQSVAWTDVEKTGQFEDGTVGINKVISSRNRWPIWKISIWEGKSHKTPLDTKRLGLLSLSVQEAKAAVSASQDADVTLAHEELKRRRGF